MEGIIENIAAKHGLVLGQFFRFVAANAFIGLLNFALISFSVFYPGFAEGPNFVFINFLSFVITTFLSFLLNKMFVFDDYAKSDFSKKFALFLLISISTVGLKFLVTFIALNVLTRFISMMISIFWSFYGYKFLVFRK